MNNSTSEILVIKVHTFLAFVSVKHNALPLCDDVSLLFNLLLPLVHPCTIVFDSL